VAQARAGAPAESAWIRTPQQQRARESLERVLDAGAQVLAEGGYDSFSIADVCRRAGVSVGSVYGRVEGKDELFLAVHERELARMSADALEVLAPGPRWNRLSTPSLISRVVRAYGDHTLANAGLLRAFVLRTAADERVLVQGSRTNEAVADAFCALLLERAPDYPHPRPENAVRTAFELMSDSLLWRLAFGAELAGASGSRAPAPSLSEWIDRLAEAATTYLLTPPPRRAR
jgi:AcrR family transcriptional regulator